MEMTCKWFAAIVFLVCATGCASPEYRQMQKKCRALETGISEQRVLATLGDPIHRRASSDPGRVLWFYSMGGDVAPLAIVMRQTTAGLVVETPCL